MKQHSVGFKHGTALVGNFALTCLVAVVCETRQLKKYPRQTMALFYLGFLIMGFCQLCQGYPTGGAPRSGGLINNDSAGAALAQQQYFNAIQAQKDAAQANLAAGQQIVLQRIHAKDPWRSINGFTNYAGGDGWYQFQGLPQEAYREGTIFKGKIGAILTICPVEDQNRLTTSQDSVGSHAYSMKNNYASQDSGSSRSSQYNQRSSLYAHGISDTSISHAYYGSDIFIVANFPYPSTQPYEEMLAYEAGYFTFTNVDDQVVTIHKLDYGMPCVKLWSPEELTAMKERLGAPRKAAEAKALKLNQDLADKGDPYGMLRMGERYRDGEGVDRDLRKARLYLQKAADAGSPTAAEELKKLPEEPVAAAK